MRIPTVKIPAANKRGWKIVNADDPRAQHSEPDAITPEAIDRMSKPEVREILDAHGTEYDGRTKLGDLRALAKRVMFVGL
jgi:hypothetical protein